MLIFSVDLKKVRTKLMKFDLSFDPNGRTRVDQDVSIVISQMHNAAIVHTQQS